MKITVSIITKLPLALSFKTHKYKTKCIKAQKVIEIYAKKCYNSKE